MRQVLVDANLQAQFAEQGYVTVPLLSPAELQGLLDAVGTLTPDDGFTPDRPFATYHCSFLDTNAAYKRQTHDLVAKTFQPHLKRLLVDFRLLNANFYVKPPGTGEFSVHQNWPGIADLSDTTVTIWCPLADVVRENGAIQVVPGSHKLLPHVEAPGSPPYFADFTDVLIRDHLVPVPMKAGEAIIFDDSLIHWSARNDSADPRIAIQAACIPVDATPAFYVPTGPADFELVEADAEFFLTQGPADLQARQPYWQSLGYIENRNRPVAADEFPALLAAGARTRAALEPAPQPRPEPPVLAAAPAPAAAAASGPAHPRRRTRGRAALRRLLRG